MLRLHVALRECTSILSTYQAIIVHSYSCCWPGQLCVHVSVRCCAFAQVSTRQHERRQTLLNYSHFKFVDAFFTIKLAHDALLYAIELVILFVVVTRTQSSDMHAYEVLHLPPHKTWSPS